MTLPASGAITFAQMCIEYALEAATAIFPTNFYGLNGSPASGALSFANFYGGQGCPQIVGSSAGSGLATLSVTWPAGHATNDVGILVIRSSNQTIATPTGCTLIAMGTGAGTAAAAGAVRIGIFWIRATSASMAAISIADSLDNTGYGFSVWRGCVTTGNPYECLSARVTGATASISIANAVAGTVKYRTAIACVASSRDSATACFTSPAFAAGNTNVTEQIDDGSSSGTGGAIGVFWATRAGTATSSIGTFTVTQAAAVNWEGYSFALIGAGQGGGGGTTYNPIAGTYTSPDDTPFTITASASAVWTWSANPTTGLTANVASGASATSITFTLAQGVNDRSTVVTVSSGTSNWTINMFTVGSSGGVVTL